MSTLTRTVEVKVVVIRQTAEPPSVTVNTADQVRWINKRQDNVKVIFLNPMTENLSCQRNFGGLLGFGTKRNEYSAKLGPNETASVCFRDPGEVKYVVRAKSGDPIGEQNIAGSIVIGRDMAREAPVQREERRTSSSEERSAARVEEEPVTTR